MSGEKTEQPTQKKLDDAKKKGQVAISKDSQILAKLLIFYMVFFWVVDGYGPKFANLMDVIINAGFNQHETFSKGVFRVAQDLFVDIMFPLVLACVVAATLITWAQTGFIVAVESLVPSFKKFDAVENVKNMFSKKSLIQLLLSVVKVVILAWVGYLVFLDQMNDVVLSYRAGFGAFLQILESVLKSIIFVSLGVFIVLTVIDWAVVYFHHIKGLKMSLQDIKDEHKQTQGNPEIKKRLKQESRNILNSSLNKVSGAKAVVANPTHIAVALDYEPGVHDIPFVLAMGVDEDALLIRKEAEKHGIPIIRNVALARMIYRDCEEEEYIQREHLTLAAEVFKIVLQLKKKEEKPNNE